VDITILESSNSNEISVKALIGKGSSLNSLGQYEDSLQYFDMALEIEPINIDVLKKRTFTLAQLGELEEARECFEMLNQMKLE